MIVYVLSGTWSYEGSRVLGVYSTLKLAQDAEKEYQRLYEASKADFYAWNAAGRNGTYSGDYGKYSGFDWFEIKPLALDARFFS